jgi:hypothetical protein
MKALIASTLALVLTLLVMAQEAPQESPSYQDDRSSATALVQSLYNAIDRKEYLRAWSYYAANVAAGETDEAAKADYETFKKGYENTEFVTLITGEETQEGAAGSTFYKVPVAIDAKDTAGKHTKFTGCYTMRLVQPAVQDAPPFIPLHIESGDLQPATGELESILPKTCD